MTKIIIIIIVIRITLNTRQYSFNIFKFHMKSEEFNSFFFFFGSFCSICC